MESARCAIEVTAGILVGTPMPEYTRQWFTTSAEWNADGVDQGELLATINGQAQGYAALLMLQPDRLNWVKTEWIWF